MAREIAVERRRDRHDRRFSRAMSDRMSMSRWTSAPLRTIVTGDENRAKLRESRGGRAALGRLARSVLPPS
jgi:hypothetical protein